MARRTTQIFRDEPFTASIGRTKLNPGRYIDHLSLSLKTRNTAAGAIAVETMLGLLNPLQVRMNGTPIVQVRAEDLFALNALMWDHKPATRVSGAVVNDETTVHGLKVPLWVPPAADGAYDVSLTRVAVTNTGTETVTLIENASTETKKDRYLHYIERPVPAPGATGFGQVIALAQPPGSRLEGVLFRSPTVASVTDDTAQTVRQVRLIKDSNQLVEADFKALRSEGSSFGRVAEQRSPTDFTIMEAYSLLDLRHDPIDGPNLSLQVDAGVNEAYRWVEVYSSPHGAGGAP